MVNKVAKPVVDKKEEKYRKENFPDVSKIVDKKLLCTSCNLSVKPLLLKGKTKVHPFMDTLLCEKCHSFFGDGDFSTDEDGSDKYCRWCGQGGTLYLCSTCTAGFCKRCIKRNLPRAVWKEVEDDDWQCLCCKVAPLYELRAQAWASLEYVKANFKDKNDLSSRKRKTKADSDPDSESAKKSKKDDSSSRKRKTKADSDSESESAKKSKKSDDNEEEEEAVNTPRKSSRDKGSKKKSKGAAEDGESSDEEDKSKKMKAKQFKYARSKLSSILADVAKMTEVTKRKAEDFKKKKITAHKVNDLDSVLATAENIKIMLLSVEDMSAKLRETATDFVTKFEKSIQEQNGVEEKKSSEENGDLDTSEKKDETNGSEKEEDKKDTTDVEMKEDTENEKADDSTTKEDKSEEEDSKSDKDEKTKSDKDSDMDKTVDPDATPDDLKNDTKEVEDPKSESN